MSPPEKGPDEAGPFVNWSGKRGSNSRPPPWQGGALPLSYFRGNGASEQNRTVDTRIFSPLLYQLSYRGIMATRTRLELVTSAVTGRHSNQLNHRAVTSAVSVYRKLIPKSSQSAPKVTLFQFRPGLAGQDIPPNDPASGALPAASGSARRSRGSCRGRRPP